VVFLITTGSGFLNPSESENCQFQVLFGGKKKIRIKELLGLVISKTAKNLQFS
jgi:hypothetical protein